MRIAADTAESSVPAVATESLGGESRVPEPTRGLASDLDCYSIYRVRSYEMELESGCPFASDYSPDEESEVEGDGAGDP